MGVLCKSVVGCGSVLYGCGSVGYVCGGCGSNV